MKIDRQTAIIIGVSTVMSFIGDIFIYSMGAGKFTMPQGKEALKILVIGAASGFVIDYSVKQIGYKLMTDSEKKLDEITQAEKEKIRNGERANSIPVSITYAPTA